MLPMAVNQMRGGTGSLTRHTLYPASSPVKFEPLQWVAHGGAVLRERGRLDASVSTRRQTYRMVDRSAPSPGAMLGEAQNRNK